MGIKAWSNSEEEELKYKYLNETTDIEELSEYFNKGYRSVISKLVNMKIYQKPIVEKNNRTVKMMLQDLESILEIQIEGLNLNKKANLLILTEAVEDKLKDTKQ